MRGRLHRAGAGAPWRGHWLSHMLCAAHGQPRGRGWRGPWRGRRGRLHAGGPRQGKQHLAQDQGGRVQEFHEDRGPHAGGDAHDGSRLVQQGLGLLAVRNLPGADRVEDETRRHQLREALGEYVRDLEEQHHYLLPDGPDTQGAAHILEGRRRGPQLAGGGPHLPDGPVVEPRVGAPGDPAGAPYRADEACLRHPLRGDRHHRGEDNRAPTEEANRLRLLGWEQQSSLATPQRGRHQVPLQSVSDSASSRVM
mmetsp:Transcript_47775/g.133193  ORF Transcript_47775/g.133193 Transcript_47775/m.133193 type:complete len:252 (+) Transcript_47775:1316-2071(+)